MASALPPVPELDYVAQAYDNGRITFMGITLMVAPGTLVPRPETELLGKTAVESLRGMDRPRVVDLCCGAGNLACAIAHHVPRAHVWAADLTESCVELTRRNAAFCAVSERVSIHRGDLFTALEGLELERTVDLVVCNPPYISEKRLENDRAHLLELEPREAFSAGPYGLSIHMRAVKDAAAFLKPGGLLMFEVGLGQDSQVKTLFARAKYYEEVAVIPNAEGEGRVVTGRRSA